MNRQSIFTTVYLGLRSQNFARSLKPNSSDCLYRAPDGKRCAIGHCIPSNKYRIEMEAWPLMRVAREANLPSDDNFYAKLQEAHDEAEEPDHMVNNLIEFASQYDLEIPE